MGDGTQVSLDVLRVYPPEQVETGEETQATLKSARAGIWALVTLGAVLAPAVAAIWSVPWFVTQDGPAHVYNAEILKSSVGGFDSTSPWYNVYTVRWQPIPNWAGPISLAGLVACLPAWLADRIMTSVTLVGFAVVILWLRWRVAGGRGLSITALLASILAMNMAWLFGFTSFMLGACLFPITLGVWWEGRDRLSLPRLVVLAALLTLGYFCHLVSLGLTALGLLVLAATAPVRADGASPWQPRLTRLARTCLIFLPVVILGLCYLWIATQRAPMRPRWENLSDPWSPRAWIARLEWVDPISLAIRDGLPFTDRYGSRFVFFAPVIWLAMAIILWCYGRSRNGFLIQKDRDRRCWFLLTAILVIGGVVGPDSLGAAHGDYLPQRIVLLGLVAMVPIFGIEFSRSWGKGATVALAAAVILQSIIIWDYALYSDRTAGQIIRAREAVKDGQRIAALLVSTRSRFRANPLLHAANWLGVGTGNIIWNNYETLHYYFPVQFQPGIDRPFPDDLEWVSIHEDPRDAGERSRVWEQILTQHADSIDVVVVWKTDPTLDSITARWFDRVDRRGEVQVFRRGDREKK
jgi:hypothetical protein